MQCTEVQVKKMRELAPKTERDERKRTTVDANEIENYQSASDLANQAFTGQA